MQLLGLAQSHFVLVAISLATEPISCCIDDKLIAATAMFQRHVMRPDHLAAAFGESASATLFFVSSILPCHSAAILRAEEERGQ